MAIGLITSPASWLLGTVAAPSWFQNAQDNINALLQQQTTLAGIVLDSAGGSAVSARTVDQGIALFRNSAGNNRYVIDHNGFPMGRISIMDEQWPVSFSVSATGAIANMVHWTGTISSGSLDNTALGDDINARVIGVGTAVKINPGTANTNKASLGMTVPRFDLTSVTMISVVMEWEFYMTSVGANNITYYLGVAGQPDIAGAASSEGAWFRKASGDTTWQAVTSHTTQTTTNTGITPVANTFNRFRLEIHGSASPYGAATARFFIDDALVATNTTNMPVGTQVPAFGGICTAGGAGYGALGPVRMVFNRYLNLPSL